MVRIIVIGRIKAVAVAVFDGTSLEVLAVFCRDTSIVSVEFLHTKNNNNIKKEDCSIS